MRDIAIIALLKGVQQTAAKFGYEEDIIKSWIANLNDDPFFAAIRKLIWECLCKSDIEVTSMTFKLSLNSLQIFKKHYEANIDVNDLLLKEGEENKISKVSVEGNKKVEENKNEEFSETNIVKNKEENVEELIDENIEGKFENEENTDMDIEYEEEKKEISQNPAWFEEDEEEINNLGLAEKDKTGMEKIDIEKLGEALDEMDSDYE
ncbi:unnamed protein product [Blepharisma stoltei]|uniref:Uncharacterized protein n=1 Tax=Blepharisma stoltei TaxID=1481888 RepID=A0AAU9ICN6_9CILI|nr:unnamed protein product [Blepharisma stoltei]